MLSIIAQVFYVLIAIAMITLILMQRGAGASAGSGFGGGASATVFGARGSANFLSKATKWLAITFFAITLGMAWYATHRATSPAVQGDLGVMSQVPAAPGAADVPSLPSALPSTTVPAAPAAAPAQDSTVPQAPAPAPAAQTEPPAAQNE